MNMTAARKAGVNAESYLRLIRRIDCQLKAYGWPNGACKEQWLFLTTVVSLNRMNQGGVR